MRVPQDQCIVWCPWMKQKREAPGQIWIISDESGLGELPKRKVSGKVVSVLEAATEESKSPQGKVITPPHARATPETLVTSCHALEQRAYLSYSLTSLQPELLQSIQEMSLHFHFL